MIEESFNRRQLEAPIGRCGTRRIAEYQRQSAFSHNDTEIEDSFNHDDSTNVDVALEDSLNNNSVNDSYNGDHTDVDVEIEDSLNNNSTNSVHNDAQHSISISKLRSKMRSTRATPTGSTLTA